jgi:hypothetical protein
MTKGAKSIPEDHLAVAVARCVAGDLGAARAKVQSVGRKRKGEKGLATAGQINNGVNAIA